MGNAIHDEVKCLQPFDYFRPQNLEQASALLAQADGHACVLAGGTALLPDIEYGRSSPRQVVDIKNLPGLRDLHFDPSRGLTIGAAVTIRQLMAHADVRRYYPLLVGACEVLGTPPVRNRITVGGNLCTASPAADLPPALLCYEAMCHLYGPAGARSVPLTTFFRGRKQTIVEPGEILVRVTLPPPAGRGAGVYHKLRTGQSGHLTMVGVAVLAMGAGNGSYDWRIALAAVAPHPLRATAAEECLHGYLPDPATIHLAAQLAEQAAQPIDDHRASARYRRAMVGVLARRGIETVIGQLAGGAT